jgi:hypothetical protein
MIGVTITPSQIDYSKIITPETVEKLIVGECVILTGFAKELAPIATGQLKSSIMWATNKDNGGLNEGGGEPTSAFNYLDKPDGEGEGFVGSHLEYAGAVEYGIKDRPNYPRQPYLRPAIDYSKKTRESKRKGVINASIKAAYKKGGK